MRFIAKQLHGLAVPIDKLKPDPKNVRKHNARNLDSIKYSLEKFGQRTPVVANKAGVILAGNARYEVAKQLGWSHLAVVYVEDDPKTGQLYALADNRTAELAEWDLNLDKVLDELRIDFEPDLSFLCWNDKLEIDPQKEWEEQGMPEFDNPQQNMRRVIVYFENETDRQEFAKLVGQELTDWTKYIYYPKLIKEKKKDFAYE